MKIDFKKKIDFIIIGAQKSGTTTIANILNTSPNIFIPPEKEIPYFLDKKIQTLGWEKFIKIYFSKSKPHQLIGTSTPQYMMYDYSFKLIKKKIPNVKLIAILRDPIERLISQYNMMKRFGKEKRDINTIIKQEIKNIKYYRNLKFSNKTIKYITTSEYDRILKSLKSLFKKKQLLFLDFNEIALSPNKINKKICNFLNIEVSPIKITHSMRGGYQNYFDHNKYIQYAIKIFQLKKILPFYIIKKLRILIYKIDQINVRPNTSEKINKITKENIKILKKHYKESYKIIKSIQK